MLPVPYGLLPATGRGGCHSLFFFSSRRRHTRWNCDWSSDVCSSDLSGPSAEQRTRARLFAQRRLIDVLDPADLSAEKLAQRLVEDLRRNDYPVDSEALPMDGAREAADRLLELVREETYATSA